MREIFSQLSVNPQKGFTLVMQLKTQLTWLIASGKLKPGDKLPNIRQMAEHLSVNLHTVRSAYHLLEAEGLLETLPGKGSHVLPFSPNQVVQTPPGPRSHSIGVIVPSWSNPFYHMLLQGVEEVAQSDLSLIILCVTHDDPSAVRRNFVQLAAKGVDGILVASQDTSALHSAGTPAPSLPFVSIDDPSSQGYSVQMNLEGVGYQATQHLIEHGHRRIGLVTFREGILNTQPVEQGYLKALQEAGVEFNPAWVTRTPDFMQESGKEAAQKLLSKPQPPTAIFAIADILALGVMQAIRSAGLRIPQDIALVSFNDIPFASLVEPPLTTVVAPAVQMGRAAMDMLNKLINGKHLTQKQIWLPTSLVIRQSCGLHS